MKTKLVYRSILSNQGRKSLFQKILVVSVIATLLAAFLPASSVFAAPASDWDPPFDISNLESEWSNKITYVRMQNLFYAQVRLFPADFEDSDDMARAYELLHKYGLALKQANAIILAHAGLDKTGDVIDAEDAIQSVQDLGIQIHIMRGILTKIEEEGYKIHRIR